MTLRHLQPRGAPERRPVRLVPTTLKIDDDVLEAACCIAADERVSVDEIVSRLARRGLEPRPGEPAWARFPPSMVPRPRSSPRGGADRRLEDAWQQPRVARRAARRPPDKA